MRWWLSQQPDRSGTCPMAWGAEAALTATGAEPADTPASTRPGWFRLPGL
jgi:hypothetical protein